MCAQSHGLTQERKNPYTVTVQEPDFILVIVRVERTSSVSFSRNAEKRIFRSKGENVYAKNFANILVIY